MRHTLRRDTDDMTTTDQQLACPCSSTAFTARPQTFADGRVHLRQECSACGRFRCYLPQSGSQTEKVRLHFGKHRGKLIRNVPSTYLQWLLRECNCLKPRLRKAVEAELE